MWTIVYERDTKPLTERTLRFDNYRNARAQFDGTERLLDADKIWLLRADGTAIDVKTVSLNG